MASYELCLRATGLKILLASRLIEQLQERCKSLVFHLIRCAQIIFLKFKVLVPGRLEKPRPCNTTHEEPFYWLCFEKVKVNWVNVEFE